MKLAGAVLRNVRRTAAGFRFLSSESLVSEPSLPDEADVVIVGGGAIGAALAYHLELKGLRPILLERHTMTAGTTWHSAGMLWRLRPNDTDIQLHAYTRWLLKEKLMEELPDEASPFTQNGGLFIATNEARFEEYKRLKELGGFFGVESEILSPEQATKVHPLLAKDAFHAALHSPGDGTIDPTTLTNAYVKAWRNQVEAKQGDNAAFKSTRLFEGVSAKSILKCKGDDGKERVEGVVTESGQRVRSKIVVNACGAWAKELHNSILGDSLPLCAMQHAMLVTEAIEGVNPSLPNVRDHDRSVYIKTQGNALAIGGYEPNPNFWASPDRDFAFGLFDMDWEAFDHNLSGHMELCPSVETAGIQSTVCGPESFTPDHKPLVGPYPSMDGYFLACGMNSMGIMLSGGLAREMAEWIVNGSPNLDLFGYDIARFHPDCARNQEWVQQSSHESYAKTYSIVHPMDEHLAGRNGRRSSVHDLLLEEGCVFQARHGFERPGFFSTGHKKGEASVLEYDYYGAYEQSDLQNDFEHKKPYHLKTSKLQGRGHETYPYRELIENHITFDWPPSLNVVAEEASACRSGVAVFDQSYFGKFVVVGKEAEKAVDYIATNRFDEEACPPGRVKYTCLCNEKGGVEADLTITKLQKEAIGVLNHASDKKDQFDADVSAFYVAAGGAQKTHNLRWIETHIAPFDCDIIDMSDRMSLLSVQGPKSFELLSQIVDDEASLSNLKKLPFSYACHASVQGHPVLILRLTFVGELGYEMHCRYEDAQAIYQALMSKGRAMEIERGIPVRNAGYLTIDSLSAEKGYRHWHADVTNSDTPFEANIGFTVSGTLKTSNKNFIGRKALEEQKESGVRRKLVCLELEENVPLYGLESIWRDGKCVGFVKSTAFGHTIGKTLAYGYVSKEGYQQADFLSSEDRPVQKSEKILNKWLKAGTYQIGDKGVRRNAKLHLKAPFDPNNERITPEDQVNQESSESNGSIAGAKVSCNNSNSTVL